MDMDIPQNVMPDIMSHHAFHFPDKTALVVGHKRVTWGEMNRNVNRVANRLLATGIERGQKVCFLMQTSLEYFGSVALSAHW
ncbi:MAG: AMP-binding protein [Devosia sp.]